MSIRIGVMIDVDATTPEEAYSKLYDFFAKQNRADGIDWESTDEWFDQEGNELPVNEVEAARGKKFIEVDRALKRKGSTDE